MKKIIWLCLIVSTLSAQAAILSEGNPQNIFCGSYTVDREFRGFCFTVSTTSSLPTLIVDGVEIDLNSPEAQERLEAEMRGDIEPILINQLQNIQGE